MTDCREQFVDSDFEEPDGEVERSVALIMADVLGIDRVGRRDSFYDFGGTSLAAIKICARLEHADGWRARPSWLFLNDTVADFARKVQSESAVTAQAHE
jgi:hypothetical protein